MKRISVLLSVFMIFLNACTGYRKQIKLTPKSYQKIDPEVRKRTQGSKEVTLLNHQLLPIDYMHKHPEQKGILINHYMGTGKTYLGIGFAQYYADRPVIILAPKFLKGHWQNQIASYGARNPQRFQFVSYSDAYRVLKDKELSNYVIIADEIHNLIKYLRSINKMVNKKYIKVYTKIRNAYRIIGLTGTPIYRDESDISFLINLISGKDLMPFNQESFRLKYTEIIPSKQFFRGYLTESNLMTSTLPFALSQVAFAALGPIGLFIGLPVGIFIPVTINSLLEPKTYKFRKLNVDKMQPIMNRYVSYFKFDESKFEEFPDLDFKVRKVPYNRYQYSFFLRLVEKDLPVKMLKRLLRDQVVQFDEEYIKVNSTNIHEQIISLVGSGRDIGNFKFKNKEGLIVEPPKFLKIFENLNKKNEQTVVYSNYYKSGILAFKEFLQRKKYKEKFAIIHPDLSAKEVSRIVNDYNRGDTRLLMLHPDVTEGVSLKGTQYLHILEPMVNSTVLEQVIGRTRRFQSHSHLPEEKQKVTVFLWQSTSSSWNLEFNEIKRVNWFKRYRELNYLSRWGIGLYQIDENYDKKVLNPEELAYLKMRTVKNNIMEIQELLKSESIEKAYKDE